MKKIFLATIFFLAIHTISAIALTPDEKIHLQVKKILSSGEIIEANIDMDEKKFRLVSNTNYFFNIGDDIIGDFDAATNSILELELRQWRLNYKRLGNLVDAKAVPTIEEYKSPHRILVLLNNKEVNETSPYYNAALKLFQRIRQLTTWKANSGAEISELKKYHLMIKPLGKTRDKKSELNCQRKDFCEIHGLGYYFFK